MNSSVSPSPHQPDLQMQCESWRCSRCEEGGWSPFPFPLQREKGRYLPRTSHRKGMSLEAPSPLSGQSFTNKHRKRSGFSILASVTSLGLWSSSVLGIKWVFRPTILMRWSCLSTISIASFSASGNSSNSLCAPLYPC